MIIPTTFPVANPAAYPIHASGFPRCPSTLVTAMIQMDDWKNPRNQTIGRRPRTMNRTRIVSSVMSQTRSRKIASAIASGVRGSAASIRQASTRAGWYIRSTYSRTIRRMLNRGASVRIDSRTRPSHSLGIPSADRSR